MTETSHKRCADCGEEKPLDEFYSKQSYCKPCHRARVSAWRKTNRKERAEHWRRKDLKRRYGITLEQWDEMYEAQGGCCAICGTTEPGGSGRFHVDHCHDSGNVRALLCSTCNAGLGSFKDNPELLQAAIEYLEVHNECKLDAS